MLAAALALAAAADTATAPAPAASSFSVAAAGISGVLPPGWHRADRKLTRLGFPIERLALASFPLRPGGSCGPQRAVREMPAGGALIFLLEYRPARGRVWSGLRRGNFKPRPRRFRLRDFARGPFGCSGGASRAFLMWFHDAGRPLHVEVMLGRRAGERRIAEVRSALDSLRFKRLPPPPPDPYAGWPTLIDGLYESIRVPPRWPAAVAVNPRAQRRPRTLFLAASRALPALRDGPRRVPRSPAARRRARSLPEMPSDRTLDAIADTGVLLWVREERRGPPSADFPRLPTNRPFPADADLLPVAHGPGGAGAGRGPEGPPGWVRAGLWFRGHRFSLWIGAGKHESSGDWSRAALALRSLGINGGRR